jgi:hypothetical protein
VHRQLRLLACENMHVLGTFVYCVNVLATHEYKDCVRDRAIFVFY